MASEQQQQQQTWRSALAACVLTAVAPLAAHAQAQPAAAPGAAAAPYAWKAATIKANGFVNGIVYSPVARNLVFMNTDMGGAYRWDESAKRWVCLTDWAKYDDPAAKHMGVETFAVDPTDGNRAYMAVGTYMSPTAIMRSTDGGVTWARTDVPFESNGNGSGRNTGQRMNVDPNAPNLLYYGTRDDGLWRSTDHAATWSRVDSFPAIGNDAGWSQNTGVVFTLIDRSSGTPGAPSKVVYAGVIETADGKPRLYRSTDAGQTWAPLPGGQPTGTNLFPQRAALAPDGRTLYVTYATSDVYPGPYGVKDGNVFKITDPAGDSPAWADVSPPSTYAFSAVTLDPIDPQTVYVSEMGNYNPADRIWRSTDAAGTWAVTNPNSHRDDSSAPFAKASKVHWLGDLQIDPFDRNVALFTTGYGLYRTTNLTAAEPAWTFFNEGFEQSACTELVSPNDGPVHLISAIGDRDGYRHDDFDASPALGGHGQSHGMSKGTSTDIDVAFGDSRYLVRTTNATPYIQYSTDNAVTWRWVAGGGVPANVRRGGEVALSADGTRVVWAPSRTNSEGDGAGVFYHAARTGDAWSEWRQATIDGSPAGLHPLADPTDANTFYAVGGGAAYRSGDGGATWTRTSDAAPRARWVRAVPGHRGHLWAVANGAAGLSRSTDGGATWALVNESAVTDAYVLALGAAAPGKAYPSVFVGGKVNGASGLHRSDDEGATWTEVSDPDHHFGRLTVIQGDPRVHGRVYLGTNGRGIVVGDIRGTQPR